MKSSSKKSLAFLISRVLGPLPLILVMWLTVSLKSGIGLLRALWVYPLILFVTVLVPTVIFTYLIITKRVSDIEWSQIADRKKYLLPITLISLFFLNIFTLFLTNSTVFHLSLLLSCITSSMTIVWAFFNFKISGHVVIATLTIAGIILYFGLKFLWLYIFLIPLIWARQTLKIHSLPQLVAGFLLPTAIMLLAILVFGWPNIPN